MNMTISESKKMKKYHRIINIGTLKNDSYNYAKFVKPLLETFNEERNPIKQLCHEKHVPESIIF